MDETPESIKPTYQIVKKGFFETTKGRIIFSICIGLLGFVGLISILRYFDIISLKPPANLTGQPLKITLVSENYGFKAGELTFDCPVESAFCNSQKLFKRDNKDTVSYQAASGSAVLNLVKIPGKENVAAIENQQTGKKYFYESVISEDQKSCYTIAYTLPIDATFGNILDLEALNKKGSFATLGEQTFEVEGGKGNVLIQIRNTPMDPSAPCSLLKKTPEFFEQF